MAYGWQPLPQWRSAIGDTGPPGVHVHAMIYCVSSSIGSSRHCYRILAAAANVVNRQVLPGWPERCVVQKAFLQLGMVRLQFKAQVRLLRHFEHTCDDCGPNTKALICQLVLWHQAAGNPWHVRRVFDLRL